MADDTSKQEQGDSKTVQRTYNPKPAHQNTAQPKAPPPTSESKEPPPSKDD